MEYKILSITVPVDAELFNDTFTPEENYTMIKMGREHIIKQRTENRENNRQKYRERLQELETQVDAMKRELQKYGVIFTPAKI